ncbi:flagellar brake domain-containing protein [Halobacillus shinanisalinarum]|uniref:Flagellar brake domain-containing protein n=1 Tax=Halobacillus shinanisalinarum TaxID=2932258 RepID=A0ABY4GZK1_9BACI|nr:flagellar brake domain-containing protein [Halobacillus shinanisalinarum]UOQ93598.1 flagellar brake domain-containing protein [Halobacillus shinanisalinarum]
MGLIKVGTPIILELYEHSQNEPECYKCKLVDDTEEYIYIDYPVKMDSGKTAFFFEGTEFYVSFVGEDESVYRFKTEVVARKKMNIPVLVLTFPGRDELVRIQRRKYVRVESSLDVAVSGEGCSMTSFTSVTKDLSGGGAAILFPQSHGLTQNQEIEIVLVLPMNSGENRYVETKAKIIRIGTVDNNHRVNASVEFINITEKHRQSIVQYCFEQQMYMRKRKLN